MFKKRSFRKSRPATVAKQISRALNKRERTAAMWHPLFSVNCAQSRSLPAEECPNLGAISLWNPLQELTAGASPLGSPVDFEGKVIERMVGNLWFRPVLPIGAPLTAAQRFDAYGNMDVLMRVGLMKQRAQIAPNLAESLLTWNPLDASAGATNEGDWTQGRWMRTWDHLWGSEFKLSEHWQQPSCCSQTTSVSATNTLASGTGTIVVPATVTTCAICGLDAEDNTWGLGPLGTGPFMDFETRVPSWWNLKFDIKRRLRMENTDRLDLWLGWEATKPPDQTGRSVQPELHILGQIKALVGSGA